MKLNKLEKALISLPEIQAEKGVIQNEYHAFDVYGHTIEVVKFVKEKSTDSNLIAAAYLHDIGKPVTAKPRSYDGILQYDKQGNLRHIFPEHESVGEEMTRKINPNFFEKYELNQNQISKLVGAHYLPMKGIQKMRKTQSFGEFIKAFKNLEETIDGTKLDRIALMNLFYADTLGKGNSMDDEGELLQVKDLLIGEPSNSEFLPLYEIQKEKGQEKDWRYSEKN